MTDPKEIFEIYVKEMLKSTTDDINMYTKVVSAKKELLKKLKKNLVKNLELENALHITNAIIEYKKTEDQIIEKYKKDASNTDTDSKKEQIKILEDFESNIQN